MTAELKKSEENMVLGTFEDFLKSHLIHDDYISLPAHMGESERYTTMIKRNPAIGDTHHLAVIVKLVQKHFPDVTPATLMSDYGFGSSTISDAEKELMNNNPASPDA